MSHILSGGVDVVLDLLLGKVNHVAGEEGGAVLLEEPLIWRSVSSLVLGAQLVGARLTLLNHAI